MSLADVRFRALGTTAQILVADPSRVDIAERALRRELDAIDLAASRFRDDAEIARIATGAWTPVSSVLFEAMKTAVRVAAATDGIVDPTVGGAMNAMGYRSDFDSIDGSNALTLPAVVPGYERIELDARRRMVRVPVGVEIDLGSSAKALAADRAAHTAAESAGCGVLVNLGGDIAVAGDAPDGGWLVFVTDDHRAGRTTDGQTIALSSGGLATSGTTVRRWRKADRDVHHIVDPRTGLPAAEVWRTSSVTALTCVDANAAATASIVLGFDAPGWLERLGLSARLVTTDGDVFRVGGWPR
jgi:FAD:protein FMN transferase